MSAVFLSQDIRTVRARLHVRTAGSGPPVLLLHGVMSDAQIWDPLISALCNNFFCIVPDMAGYGQSERLGAHAYAYNEESWTEDAFDVLTALGVPQAHVMGHAEGAHLAIRLAARAPSTVVSLTAMASPLWSEACARARHAGSSALWGGLALAAWVRARTARGDVTVASLSDRRGLEVARAMLVAGRDERTLRASLSTLQTPMLALLDNDAPDEARSRLRHDTAAYERVRVSREPVNELRRGLLDAAFATHVQDWLQERNV